MIVAIWISGCCSQPVDIKAPVLSELDVPVVKEAELKCLTPDTRAKLRTQNALRKERIITLTNMYEACIE